MIKEITDRIQQLNLQIYNHRIKPIKNIDELKQELDFLQKLYDDNYIRSYIDNFGRKHIYQYFMDIAYIVASRSTCIKRKVGSIIVDNQKHIIATGYNNPSVGLANCTKETCILDERGKCAAQAVHSEANSVMQCDPLKRQGSTMFLTDYPCDKCALLILNSGIKTVIYDKYKKQQFNWLEQDNHVKCYSLIDAIRNDLYQKWQDQQMNKQLKTYKQFLSNTFDEIDNLVQ